MPERDHDFYAEKHEEDHCPGCGMKFSYAVDTCICEEEIEEVEEPCHCASKKWPGPVLIDTRWPTMEFACADCGGSGIKKS